MRHHRGMSHPADYPMSNPQDFSDLEVAPKPRREEDSFKELQRPPSDCLPELASPPLWESFSASDQSQASPNPFSDVSALSPSAIGTPTPLPEKDIDGSRPKIRRICGIRAVTFILLLLAVVLLCIGLGAGVPLALLVGRGKGSQSSIKANTTNSSPPAVRSSISNDSSLASIAYNDGSGVTQYRLYYQGEDDFIKESAWNATSNAWQVSNTGIGKAKSKTPIAAVVTGPVLTAFVSGFTL